MVALSGDDGDLHRRGHGGNDRDPRGHHLHGHGRWSRTLYGCV